MDQLHQETTGELAHRWTVRMNELNRYGARRYPDLLCIEVLRLVRQTGRVGVHNPFETDLLFMARTLIQSGEPKGMIKLHEVIIGRL